MLQSLMKATLLLVMALLLLGSVGARQLAAPFYPPGTPVKDLDATTYDVVVNSKKKYIVVYYASWCGHCQRFAPIFIKTATKYLDSGISFAAIDCVKERDICVEHQIKSYPTVRAHGFGESIEKDFIKQDIHSIDKVEVFIENHINPKSLRGDGRGNARDQKHSPEDALKKSPNPMPRLITPPLDPNYKPEEHILPPENDRWIKKTLQAAARISTPQDRLHDALTSLRFLLQMEILTQLNDPEEKNDVMNFLKFVINLLPDKHQDPFLRFLVYLHNVDTMTSGDVDAAALDAFGDDYSNWVVCGMNEGEVAKKAQGLFAHAQEAYLCGLWTLFHFMTVAAEERFIMSISEVLSSNVDVVTITALDVMNNIHLCVDKYFNCRHCRLHFLDTYSKCYFGRCDVKKADFDKLQFWLWNFHNFVTQSIMQYHLSSVEKVDGTENYYKNMVNWPDLRNCASCYGVLDVPKHDSLPIIKFVRESYWDKSWKLRTIRDYKPEYPHAMRNPFEKSVASLSRRSQRVAGHDITTTSLTSAVSSEELKISPESNEGNESGLMTFGALSLIGIFFLVLVSLFMSCRKKSNHLPFKRGRYS